MVPALPPAAARGARDASNSCVPRSPGITDVLPDLLMRQRTRVVRRREARGSRASASRPTSRARSPARCAAHRARHHRPRRRPRAGPSRTSPRCSASSATASAIDWLRDRVVELAARRPLAGTLPARAARGHRCRAPPRHGLDPRDDRSRLRTRARVRGLGRAARTRASSACSRSSTTSGRTASTTSPRCRSRSARSARSS